MLISVIMPAYNMEKYIAQSIESVIAQTYNEWELVVVDDGSNDNTSLIVKEYAVKDQRIKYFYQENGHLAKARNTGISMAKGEIVAFLDSDDLWLPQKLKISLQILLESKVDLLFSESYHFDENIFDLSKADYPVMGVLNMTYSGDEALRLFIERNRVPVLTVLVYKSKVTELGGFDTNLKKSEDFDLWIRLLKSGSIFKSISQPLSAYRMVNNSMSSSDRLSSKFVLELLKKNFDLSQLEQLKVIHFIKAWIRKYIISTLTANEYSQLDMYMRHFKFDNKIYKIVFKLRNIIGFKIFKSIVFRNLNRI
jgi:teichuronic acid biosynthesis glycosyltransferase TuaG